MRLYLKENPKVTEEIEKNLRDLMLSDTPAHQAKAAKDETSKTNAEPPKKTTSRSTA